MLGKVEGKMRRGWQPCPNIRPQGGAWYDVRVTWPLPSLGKHTNLENSFFKKRIKMALKHLVMESCEVHPFSLALIPFLSPPLPLSLPIQSLLPLFTLISPHQYCWVLKVAEELAYLSGQFSHSVESNSLWPQGLQHTRLPCPSPTPRAYSNSCPWSQWCHPTISSSVIPFSSRFQSFPASGSFQMS